MTSSYCPISKNFLDELLTPAVRMFPGSTLRSPLRTYFMLAKNCNYSITQILFEMFPSVQQMQSVKVTRQVKRRVAGSVEDNS